MERHFVFEIMEGEYEGEQFIVGAKNLEEAKSRIEDYFDLSTLEYVCELTEEEAEMSGLDEY